MRPRVKFSRFLPLLLLPLLPIRTPAEDTEKASAFAEVCADQAARAEEAKQRAAAGAADGWLFLASELKHLAQGEFWKDPAAIAGGDPAAAIIAYHQALQELGVTLVVVPVPAKAAIYPEKLAPDTAEDAPFPTAPFFAQLAEAGVLAVDLEPVFREAKTAQKIYCEQDSHWTPWACRLAAEAICKLPAVSEAFTLQQTAPRAGEEIKITGDLADALPSALSGRETLTVFKAAAAPVPPVDGSAVILVGDSHTVVFSEAGGTIKNHTTGAGVRDHLQARLGFPLTVITTAASGADGARALLARKAGTTPGFWDNRKLVIWCFAAREFTQGKWRAIPAQPGK